MVHPNNVETAIKKVGTIREVAKKLGIAHPSVIEWRDKGEVPWRRLEAFCELTKTHPREVNTVAARLFDRWPK